MLTLQEMATLLGITPQWVKIWKGHGLLAAQTYSDKDECLYRHLGMNPPARCRGQQESSPTG
jgi:hypothetical protein